MLKDMYPLAVRAGIDAEHYWDLTVKEIIVQAQGNRQRHLDQLKERASMDYTLSRLMTFAVNDPNKMPDIKTAYGFMDDERADSKPQEEIPDWKKDRLEFMKQAERIKNYRNSKK